MKRLALYTVVLMASTGSMLSAHGPAALPAPPTNPNAGPGATPFTGPTGGPAAMPRKKAPGGAGRVTSKWGKTPRTANAYHVLDFHWIDAEWPVRHAKNYETTVLPLSDIVALHAAKRDGFQLGGKKVVPEDKGQLRAKRPAMVYLYDPNVSRKDKLATEHRMFGSDDIAGVSNYVDCFHMAAEDLEYEQFKKTLGRKLPALVFISAEGTPVKVLQGKITKSEVQKAFGQLFDKSFGGSFKAHVADLRKVVADLEKVEDKLTRALPRLRLLQRRVAKDKKDKALVKKLEVARKKYDGFFVQFQQIERRLGRLLSKPAKTGDEVARK